MYTFFFKLKIKILHEMIKLYFRLFLFKINNYPPMFVHVRTKNIHHKKIFLSLENSENYQSVSIDNVKIFTNIKFDSNN